MPKAHWFPCRRVWLFITVIPSGVEGSRDDKLQVTSRDVSDFARHVARNPGLSRVAIDGSKVVGVAMCGHDGRRGHIYHLAVDPACRRYGLGKRLVQECLDGLRRVGIMRAIILVADYNLGGAEFWKRAGWEDIPGAAPMGIDV